MLVPPIIWGERIIILRAICKTFWHNSVRCSYFEHYTRCRPSPFNLKSISVTIPLFTLNWEGDGIVLHPCWNLTTAQDPFSFPVEHVIYIYITSPTTPHPAAAHCRNDRVFCILTSTKYSGKRDIIVQTVLYCFVSFRYCSYSFPHA